jgi:HEPN domain-containing protein
MKPVTREWVSIAEGDFATACREMRARKSPNYDSACFHAQQCAEKYLKARLQEAGRPFPKTHDLIALLDRVLLLEPLWETMRAGLRALTAFAVDVRYPGERAGKADAREALLICRQVRRAVRLSLGLSAEK